MAAMGSRALRASSLALGALLLCTSTVTALFGGGPLKSTCTVEFHLDPDASLFELSGAVDAPDVAVLTSATGRIGLLGGIALKFVTNSSCPQDTAKAFSSIRYSEDVEFAASGVIGLYPGILSAEYEGSSNPLRIREVGFLVTGPLGDVPAEGITDLMYLESNVTVDSVNEGAWVGGTDPGPEILLGMKGMNDTKTKNVTGYLSLEGSTLSVGLSELEVNVAFEGPIIGDANGTTISGVVRLTGELTAKAVVGCSSSCGKNGHGKCGQKDDGGFFCICECGWSGAACDEPKGFCPTFSDLLVDSAGTCEGRQELDPTTRECTRCVDGWKGTKCNSCVNDNVCNAFWSDNNQICSKVPEYDVRTQLKVYSCDFRGSAFEAFVGPSIEFSCNMTGRQSRSAVSGTLEEFAGDDQFCELAMSWKGVTPVRCIAKECTIKAGSGYGICKIGACECDGKKCTGDAGETFGNGVTDIEVECKKEDDEFSFCELTFGSIAGISLQALCLVSECLDPEAPELLVLGAGKKNIVPWQLFLIGSPFFLALILGACLGVPALTFHRKVSVPPGEYVYGSSAREMDSQPQTSEIVLESVSCSVPKRKTAEEKKEEGGILRKISSMTNFTEEVEEEKSKNPLPELKGLTNEVLQMLQPPRKTYRNILQDLNCTFTTGQLVAIMGPSGCGKSTFLSVLSGMSLYGSSQRLVTGRIMVNGKKRGSWIRKIAVFVPQEDHIMAMLTVRECLTYSAILRLPIKTPMTEIFRRVYNILAELGLERIADSQVGGVHGVRGISGGERRRVTIGMEMVTRPKIILMDEPTSGLDSHTALSLISMLKGISQHGRLVMLSVHQPSPVMFNKLDKVLLLAHGFQIFLGAPIEIEGFFKRHGCAIPSGGNIAEHILSVVSRPRVLAPLLNTIVATKSRPDEETGQAPVAGTGGVRRAMNSVIMDGVVTAAIPQDPVQLGVYDRYTHWLRKSIIHLQVTFWRGFVDICRNPVLLVAHWVMATVMGIGLGVIFFDVQKDLPGAQNRLGGFFFFLAFLGFTSSTTVEVLHAERTVVLREVKAGYYSAFTYLISKIILDAVLLRAIPAILLGVPFYFLMGLETDTTKCFIFLFTAVTYNMTMGAIAMTLAILIMNSGAATLVINIVILISLLFSNFPANAETISPAIGWINHLSFIGYGMRIMAVNEIDGSTFLIAAGDLPPVQVRSDTILEVLGFSPSRFTTDVIVMVSLCFVAIILVVVSLWLQAKLDNFSKLWHKFTSTRIMKAEAEKEERVQRKATGYSEVEVQNGTGQSSQEGSTTKRLIPLEFM